MASGREGRLHHLEVQPVRQAGGDRPDLLEDVRELAGMGVEPASGPAGRPRDALGPSRVDVEHQQVDVAVARQELGRGAAHRPGPEDRDRRAHYSGTCDRTMMRGSVISSIANRRPSRPNPESFEPPYGI